MVVKTFLFPLFLLLKTVADGHPISLNEIPVKAGEIVALQCSNDMRYNDDANLIWTSYTNQDIALISNMSLAEQKRRSILVYRGSLVILTASLNHHGNYSCFVRNSSSQFWFRLTVYTTQTTEYEDKYMYCKTCYIQEACTLTCPEVNTPNLTSRGIIWHKKGEPLPKDDYFRYVGKKDSGVYICTRTYSYKDQIYNMTFTMKLDIQPKKQMRPAVIKSPRHNKVFLVDLGSKVVIDCKVSLDPDLDEVFWLSDTSFVEMNDSFPVFYTNTEDQLFALHDPPLVCAKEPVIPADIQNKCKDCKLGQKIEERRRREGITGGINITSSLVFKNVSEDDLLRNYTCKLETASTPARSVSITLAQKAQPSYVFLAVVTVCIVVVMTVTVVTYVKFKVDVTLFLRDTLGCHRTPTDGKSYDAFLLYYNSNTDAGLNDCDRKWLENVLETFYRYNLCLFERDVLPGRAEAEAVSECIEQSRTVILVPTPDSSAGSGLLCAIHAALVERQTHLVFIKTETATVPTSGSLPEALQLLGEAGDCITWKNASTSSTSSFLKQLRYYLPAPQQTPTMGLLSQSTQDVTSR